MFINVLSDKVVFCNRAGKSIQEAPTMRELVAKLVAQPGLRGTLYVQANGFIGVEQYFATPRNYGKKLTLVLSKKASALA